MQEQKTLFDEATREAEAFEDGRLVLLVKEHPRYDSRAWGGHVNAAVMAWHGDPFATVHVMSKPAGGEIRGYVRINGVLYLRTPAYPLDWPEVDREVSRRLSCPVMAADPQEAP